MLHNVLLHKCPLYQRHDIPDAIWQKLAPLLHAVQGEDGRPKVKLL